MNEISLLDWDTTQLGIKTAKASSISPKVLQNAKKAGVKLLYFVISQENEAEIEKAIHAGGILVDNKVTFLLDLKNAEPTHDPSIKIFPNKKPSDDLIQLAYEAGKYSRFRFDSNISETQFKNVYRSWMINSVSQAIASDVFFISENDKLLGVITVGEKNNRGDIGLLAVAEEARGKKLGLKLVKAAECYFIQKNYAHSQVVTQLKNIQACRLYEKCGYRVEKIEHFFHFWL